MLLELTSPIEANGPLCAQLRGVVDAEILRRALQNVASACAESDGNKIILDLHDVDSRCTVLDVHSLADDLTRLGFQPSWRMAVVGSQITTDFTFFETVCKSRGMEVRVFRNHDAARYWLATGP